jgi:hypothetical protein
MTFMGIVFLFPSSPQTSVADMNYTAVVFGGVMILSLVYYYFPKYGGIYWFKGPVPNIESDKHEYFEEKKESVFVESVEA